MPKERTTYRGVFVRQTEAARQLAPEGGGTPAWIPKSIFLYFAKDADGKVRFSVELWKEKDIEAAGFDEV